MSYGQVFDQDSDVIPDLVAAARLVAPDVLLAREEAEQQRQNSSVTCRSDFESRPLPNVLATVCRRTRGFAAGCLSRN